MINNFEEMEKKALSGRKKSIVLAMAEEADALSAITKAADRGIAVPVLVGDPAEIKRVAEESGIDVSGFEIITASGEYECAARAVELVREGKADCLMKGRTSTAAIMKAVINKEKGLRTERLLSHIAIFKSDNYHKLLIATDAAMNISPDFNTKISILENALEIARKLGIEKPKAAIIGAVEKVNTAMPATLDAALYSKMAHRGQIKNCIIDGPFALDNAISKRSCEIKGIETEVGGDADVLLFPDIESANIFYKSVSYLTDYPIAGFITGASAPIILTSRADSDRTKYLSILTAVALS